jgi:gamma-glutamyl-gamma-aminobutyrate hydrolase PuuD
MNIALTQRELNIKGWQYDCTSQDWYGFLNRHNLSFVPNTKDFDYTGIDCLLIPGGESTPNRDRVEDFAINFFLQENKPIIGVCHGAFHLNWFFGGINGKVSGHRGTNHKIKLEGQEPYVASYQHPQMLLELTYQDLPNTQQMVLGHWVSNIHLVNLSIHPHQDVDSVFY